MFSKAPLFYNCVKNAIVSNYQQTRNTVILRRKYPPDLTKRNRLPKNLKTKNYIYELVENDDFRPVEDIQIILTRDVKGYGYKSDIVEMRPNKAYTDFLLPGFAVYNTPENRSKYDCVLSEQKQKSELSIDRTVDYLSKTCLYILMNKSQQWILEPWHLTATFRRHLVQVPEHAIEMPPGEIRGPDLSLEDKEFFITVTINNAKKVNVRCRIYHWDNEGENRESNKDYCDKPHQPLFAEQAEVLKQME